MVSQPTIKKLLFYGKGNFIKDSPPEDVEGQISNLVVFSTKVRRISFSTTSCFLLTFLILVIFFGGNYFYNQCVSQMHRNKGTAQITLPTEKFLYKERRFSFTNSPLLKPHGGDDDNDNSNSNKTDSLNDTNNRFREEFEIDISKQNYGKIDFLDAIDNNNCSCRFIHDFKINITGIIDVTRNRCFVMPLNTTNIPPPKSLIDLIHKMHDGYYKVDIKIVRETMRVVTPPLEDLTQLGTYIAKECKNRPVYKLEKYGG